MSLQCRSAAHSKDRTGARHRPNARHGQNIMSETKQIWCCGCSEFVRAELIDGSEVYPHRKDLHSLPFWRCPSCRNYVGCHHKTKDRTRPLGNIPTRQLREVRMKIHERLDPLWKSGLWNRSTLYRTLSDELGYRFHTAEIRNIEQAREIYRAVVKIAGGK